MPWGTETTGQMFICSWQERVINRRRLRTPIYQMYRELCPEDCLSSAGSREIKGEMIDRDSIALPSREGAWETKIRFRSGSSPPPSIEPDELLMP